MIWVIVVMVFGFQTHVYAQNMGADHLDHTHVHAEALLEGSPFHLDRATCGTMAVMERLSNWHHLAAAKKETLAFLFQRPGLNESVLSPSGHFLIHFNRTGVHAVDATDKDQNGIPDYVDETALTFDRVWEKEIQGLGYNPPPSDDDGIYDVYIKNLSLQNAYGLTYPINYPDTITPSYMEIDNNFTDSIYHTKGLAGLHVTAAHEFHHAIQFGYYADFDAAWWQEMTAVWMEDVVYPDINDYYQYLTCSRTYSCFFDTPETSLDKFSGTLHPFGGAVYPHYLEQVYGTTSMRNVWESLMAKNPQSYRIADMDDGMPDGGFANILPRFAVWNYLTNTRSRSGYYEEADAYPLVKHPAIALTSGGTYSGSATVNYLGATYIPIQTATLSGGLRATFELSSGSDWTLVAMLISNNRVELLWPKSTTVEIPNIRRYQEVVFIPIITGLSGTQRSVTYTLSAGNGYQSSTDLIGDLNGDTAVGFPDFVAFASGFGQSHSQPDYNMKLDLNGDGPIDFSDFLIFVSHFGE